MTITDAITLIHRFAYPPEPPKKEPVPPHEEPADDGHYFGFCDCCGHTHAFCECQD